jgi:hypothetical protein
VASGEILESRILHISRAYTKFEIHPVAESARNVVPLSFEILEHDDGAAMQLIYAGKTDTAIAVNGTIVGAGSPRFFSEGPRTHNPEEALRKWERIDRVVSYIPYVGTAFIILMAVIFVPPIIRRIDQEPDMYKLRRKQLFIALAIVGLVYLGMDILQYHENHTPEVPHSVLGH